MTLADNAKDNTEMVKTYFPDGKNLLAMNRKDKKYKNVTNSMSYKMERMPLKGLISLAKIFQNPFFYLPQEYL